MSPSTPSPTSNASPPDLLAVYALMAKARALGWHDDPPPTLGIDPTSPVADENTP